MNIIDIFFVSLYLHFIKLRENGRSSIVPWFQTCVAVSLFVAIASALALKLYFGDSWNKNSLNESTFIGGFLLIGAVCFFSIKSYFFDSGKYLTVSQEYVDNKSSSQRTVNLILSIALLAAFPMVLYYFVWLNATTK